MSFAQFKKELFAIQSNFICSTCNLTYHKDWYNKPKNMCFFCTHFNPKRDTRLTILKFAEWYCIKSSYDPIDFYKEYAAYASIWCTRFNIDYTKDSKEMERELLQRIL